MSNWRTILAVDADKWACETYRANFPDVDVRCAKVADVAIPYADVYLAGPPCVSFSVAGTGKGEHDDRDGWPDFCAAVERGQPRQALAENVAGMLTERHHRYFGRILTRLEKAGYVVEYRKLDAVNYGVPQFRKRVFVWAIRQDVYDGGARHCWPKHTHTWPPPLENPDMFGLIEAMHYLSAVTVGEALGIDASIRRIRGSGVTRRDHPSDEPCPTVMQPTGGKSGLMAIEYLWSPEMLQKHPPASPASPAPTVQAKWFKGGAEGLVSMDGRTWESRHPPATPATPATTIRARSPRDGGRCTENVIVEKQLVRRLTPWECGRLQSLPDDFVWPPGISKTAMYKCIGNGWACALAARLSEALKAADPQSVTVIDIFAGAGLGAVGWHGKYWKLNNSDNRA